MEILMFFFNIFKTSIFVIMLKNMMKSLFFDVNFEALVDQFEGKSVWFFDDFAFRELYEF